MYWRLCLFFPSQTLCALIRGVHQKNKSTSGFDIINMLMGFDKAEVCMKVRACEGMWDFKKSVQRVWKYSKPLWSTTIKAKQSHILVCFCNAYIYLQL